MSKNYTKLTDDLVEWIKTWFDDNGETSNAVIGVSGGADSNILMGVLVKALGRNRVIGVIMRSEKDDDADKPAIETCKYFGVKYYQVPVYPSVNAAQNLITLNAKLKITEQAVTNLPARMRTAILYSISQCCNGRVVSSISLTDIYIGYHTRWGDECGDLQPFAQLTKEEIKIIGLEIGLPSRLIYITHDDKLPASKPDEEKLGFKISELDTYIRTGKIENPRTKSLIDKLFVKNEFKRKFVPESFYSNFYIFQP